MVEKVITSPRNVVDFARYRNAADKPLAMSVRVCRHCGAALSEGESEDRMFQRLQHRGVASARRAADLNGISGCGAHFER